MNHIEKLTVFRNRYHLLRHGHSVANLKGIIISDPKVGADAKYGLTDLGRKQVKASIEESDLPSSTVIVSSDFSRAVESAEIARSVLGAQDVIISEELRERNFGKWENTANEHYIPLWEKDSKSVDQSRDGVEDVSDLQDRVTRLIPKLESEYDDRDILLVSHGDTLQTLYASFTNQHPAEHNSLPYLKNGELQLSVQLISPK